MQLFLRYAEISGWLPNPFFTKARDCRILYILAGRGELRFPEQTVPLETGCFCYYPAGQAYWPCSSKEEPLQFITLNFDFGRRFAANIAAICPVPVGQFDDSSRFWDGESIPDPAFESPIVLQEQQLLREDFIRLVKAYHENSSHSPAKAEALLAYLLYYILEVPKTVGIRALQKALAYIEENYSAIQSNTQLAEALHYHPYHLNRLFRTHMQCTLHRYIMRIKLEKAALLLQQTQLPVFEVAHRVGFDNADHFTKCFTQKYGISPSRFRRTPNMI